MLSPRLRHPVFVLLMTCAMSAAMSFVVTLRMHRFDSAFPDAWFRSFLISAAVGIPTALLVSTPLRRLADWLCR